MSYRNEKNCIEGFNMVVIDVDNGASIEEAKLLLCAYKYLMCTTKRCTDDNNRFRIIMPMNYELKLAADDYKEFMNNIYEWLPFTCDAQTDQRSRKWATYSGEYWYNKGELINSLLFIPRTAKGEEQRKSIMSSRSLSNIERWFIDHTGRGNRSNQLIKYALMLVDSGADIDVVKNKLEELNNKLADKLSSNELSTTILLTAAKAVSRRKEEQNE